MRAGSRCHFFEKGVLLLFDLITGKWKEGIEERSKKGLKAGIGSFNKSCFGPSLIIAQSLSRR